MAWAVAEIIIPASAIGAERLIAGQVEDFRIGTGLAPSVGEGAQDDTCTMVAGRSDRTGRRDCGVSHFLLPDGLPLISEMSIHGRGGRVDVNG
jgi:hypothetical protein